MNDYGVRVAVRQSTLEGEVVASPSKSQTHRALICATLAEGISTIYNPLLCDDTEATLNACKVLGAEILTKNEEKIVIRGIGGRVVTRSGEIFCEESGSTLRFISPIVAVFDAEVTFRGKHSLARRPIKELLSVLENLGSVTEFLGPRDSLPFKIIGARETSGTDLRISGNVSSQFVSGLLFALPLVDGESKITITTDLESRNYVELTVDVLEKFGIRIEKSDDLRNFTVKGRQKYLATDFLVEGDYSSSAFLMVAGALSGGESGVTVRNLKRDSRQGDRRIVDILEEMGARIEVGESSVTVKRSELVGCMVDARNVPDLVPVIAIAGIGAAGITTINGIGRLRLKESDRVFSVEKMIRQLGCTALVGSDSISISGKCTAKSKTFLDFDDHRLVMASCVGGLAVTGEVFINNPSAIKKSYPDFFDHIRRLGGDVMTVSNALGESLRLSVFGESHGKRIGAFLEGVPKGIRVKREYIQQELEKRRSTSHLTTQRKEPDIVEIVSGIRSNVTTGRRIRLEIRNMDVRSELYEKNRNFIRPGHADYTARQKYASVFDFRGGGFLSGRMTACFVAAGAIGKKILEPQGIRILSHIVQIGNVKNQTEPSDESIENYGFPSVIKCTDPVKTGEMETAIETARKEGDSLGGIVECRIIGLPVGVGEPIFHSIEGRISQAMFSIPAVKGIEFGSGFKGAGIRGSENNDPVSIRGESVITLTNNSGGILGGISNGMPVVFRVAIKPTSSIAKEQRTIDYAKHEDVRFSVKGRHDPCIAVRAPPVVEAMAALTLADLMIAGGFVDRT